MNYTKITIYGRQPKKNDAILHSYSTQLGDLSSKTFVELRDLFREKTAITHELILQENIYVNGRAMRFDETYVHSDLTSIEYEAIIAKSRKLISIKN